MLRAREAGPEAEGLVAGARDDGLVVRGEREVEDAAAVAGERRVVREGGELPDADLVEGVAVGRDELVDGLGPGEGADLGARVDAVDEVARLRVPELEPGQEKGDSTSLQRGRSARARSKERRSRSRLFREMTPRPKISQNEWKTTEI